ncbi:hypothetical protein [Fervidibacter sacchari]
MRRETFDRQESFLSVRWRARVGPKSHHRRARLALSRLCSERLPKGQKKVLTVKAKTNLEAQTTLILDGSASSFSPAGDNASLSVWWWAQPLPKAVILLNDRRLQGATLPPRAPKSRRTLLPLSDGINDDAQKD